MAIHTSKHVRVTPEASDGARILTMRYWPRGVRRNVIAEWRRELAPSAVLLAEYKRLHPLALKEQRGEIDLWEWFVIQYVREMELQAASLKALASRAAHGETITLLCGCHLPARCHRSVLAELLGQSTNG